MLGTISKCTCKDLAHVIIANLQISIMVCVISFLIKKSVSVGDVGVNWVSQVVAFLNFFS